MHILTIAGIPLRLHWSFVGIVGALLAWAGMKGGGPAVVLVGTVAGALFGSVVLHELGHAMAARRYGIDTAHITLYPFGGIAAITRMPEEPDQELVIALAGPVVNFLLVAVFGWASLMLDHDIWGTLVAMNLVMGVFNLIPAFPMDGGRVLRALLARRMGWFPASRLAIRIGRGFAWVFLLAGMVTWSPSFLLVGAFLHYALTAEKQRLVWMVWEQRTGTTPPWDTGQSPWTRAASAGRYPYKPRWRLGPPSE